MTDLLSAGIERNTRSLDHTLANEQLRQLVDPLLGGIGLLSGYISVVRPNT
jgi:hypothetical protein